MTQQYDSIVIGGGPGGAVAALLLARSGWHVALIERRSHGKAKTCGHCLSAGGVAVLRRLGVEECLPPCAASPPTHRYRLNVPDAPPAVFDLPSADDASNSCAVAGRLAPRPAFDAALLDVARQAGVDVYQPARAELRDRTSTSANVMIEHNDANVFATCRLLIAADGLHSRIAQRAGLRTQQRCGSKAGFSFGVCDDHASTLARGLIDMYVTECGYLGLVRHGDEHLHVAGLMHHPAAMRGGPFGFVRDTARRFDRLRRLRLDAIDRRACREFVGAAPLPARPDRLADGSLALVGDAAGYEEPFTGEGMTWALQSAELLADVVDGQAARAWSSALARAYTEQWRRTIGRRQRRSRALSHLAASPRLLRAVLRARAWQPRWCQPIETGLLRRMVLT